LIKALDIGMKHASCVDFDGKGVLILGASGSGKSSLALACMSLGARLVGDDYVENWPWQSIYRAKRRIDCLQPDTLRYKIVKSP